MVTAETQNLNLNALLLPLGPAPVALFDAFPVSDVTDYELTETLSAAYPDDDDVEDEVDEDDEDDDLDEDDDFEDDDEDDEEEDDEDEDEEAAYEDYDDDDEDEEEDE
jgi:hypothetical protein